jgi:hypothetical protein
MDKNSRTIGAVFGVLCVLPAAGLGAPSVALPENRADLGVGSCAGHAGEGRHVQKAAS